MSATLTDTLHLIIHKRNVLRIAAIGVFGYLVSVAASPVASLFLTRAAPPEPLYSYEQHFALWSDTDLSSTSFAAVDPALTHGPYSFRETRAKTRKRRKGRHTRQRIDLDSEISEQRRLLSQLESEAEGKQLLGLVADSDLLLMLKQHISNHLNFINKRLNPPADNTSEATSHKNFALGNKMAANAVLDAPNTMDLTQTEDIQVSIDWTFPDQPSMSQTLPVIEPKLESPDFRIIAAKPDGSTSPITTFGSRQQTWSWLISPEKTGDRKITLTFTTSNGKAVPILTGKEPKDYRVLIPVKVLTEVGLTSTQNAWAKAIGAIIGIIGTVAGFSFWRYKTRKKKQLEDTSRDDDDYDEALDAEIILRELARHLRKREASTQPGDTDTPKNAEGAKDDPP